MSRKKQFAFCVILLITMVTAFQAGRYFSVQPAAEMNKSSQVVTFYYPVEDLVTRWNGGGSTDQSDFESLVTLVTATVAPGTWNDGHVATAVPANRMLAVTHTDDVQSEVATLLAKCREPISYYHDCLAQDVCMHCGASPMANVGDRCDKCNALRCEPRFETPKFAAIGPRLQ